MSDPTQAASSLALSTELGEDALILLRLSGEERLSSPFRFELEAEAEGAPDVAGLLGEPAAIRLTGGDGIERRLHGRVWSVRRSGPAVSLLIRPWLSLLTLRSDNRIFQEKTTEEIVTQVFDEAGFPDYRFELTGTLEPRPYCVQFGETDFAFVSRLLEEEGLGYFFAHETAKHDLVIFDDVSACAALPGGAVPFLPLPRTADFAEDRRIQSLAERSEMAAALVSARDYNFETPAETLEVSVGDGGGHYVYPGRYPTTESGEGAVTRRLAALEAEAFAIEGASPLRLMAAGATFALSDHPAPDLNQDYLIRAVTHEAERRLYSNRFEAQPKEMAWRPPLATPRPRMPGPQTAKVVGKDGEEIWTDKHGRIKVQFHWDRQGESDENSSCWLRVAQGWAAAGWGALFTPRIGSEVVVSFLDGDPDRPLVTGVVYNADNVPPYELPGEQTKTTVKSNSSKDAEGFNELRFEDKAGEEEVYLHAQKDMNVEIVENRTVTLEKGDDKLTVSTGSLTIEVKGDITIKSDGSISISAGGSLELKAGGAASLEAGSSLDMKGGSTFSLKGSASGAVDGGGALTVKGGTVQIN